MGKYQKLLNEYYEAIAEYSDDPNEPLTPITKTYPKEVFVKFDLDGSPYLEYYGYCGTNRGLKSIYIPRIDLELDNFYCEKEALVPYSFTPDFEEDDEDGADPYLSDITFMSDFDEAAPNASYEVTKWFYGFKFLTEKLRPTNDNTIFFILAELTKTDCIELELEEKENG